MFLCRNWKVVNKFYSTIAYNSNPKVCIVGSGPAGFYTANEILKVHKDAEIDIYEKLPVPFGLVRYGVAPDHPEVKSCIKIFTQAAKKDKISFYGNIAVGTDITFSDLQEAYHAVVLAYGAGKDRMLGISGENLSNVVSAKRLVGWYNGLPADADLPLNLDIEDVSIIGQGNVAIDVARILLTPIDILRQTDIPEPVLERLCRSKVKNVTLIGRRGPEHVAFTIKEFREMINLPNAQPLLHKSDFKHLPALIKTMKRPRKRLIELVAKSALNPGEIKSSKQWSNAARSWTLKFFLSPTEILSKENQVTGIKCVQNRMENEKVVATNIEKVIPCQMVIRSIGYTSIQIDSTIPFDYSRGIVPNINGRVNGIAGTYVSGWLGTGPVGVIAATMESGYNTCCNIMEDLQAGVIGNTVKGGNHIILKKLQQKGIEPVSFDDWSQLDQHEIDEGKRLGKPREKITNINDMLQIEKKPFQ